MMPAVASSIYSPVSIVRHWTSAIIYLLLLLPGLTHAEITWFSSAAIGSKSLDFDQDVSYAAAPNTSGVGWQFPTQTLVTDYDIDIDFINLTLSTGFAIGKYYVVFDYDTNINSEEDDYSTFSQSADAGSFSGDVTTTQVDDADFDRNDYSLTAGWNFAENFALFVGYKYGETEIDYDTIAATGSTTSVASDVNSSFEEDGYYIGVSYSIPLKIGLLAFSTAWADLDGDYDQSGSSLLARYDGSQGGGAYQINNDNFTYDGDTDGLSFSISLSGSIDGPWGYFVSLKYQQYDFDSKAVITQTGIFGGANNVTGIVRNTDIESEETVTSLNIGTRYYF